MADKIMDYPFSALVGQEQMKLALLLNAVNPAIGGVLIRGEKGTAKSTAVRGIAALLPLINVAEGCPLPFAPADLPNDVWQTPVGSTTTRPAPLVNLPLGVTEDRLLGTLELESVLQRGEKRFEPGLLAHAHQGILYIDEVNLLNDHIVDMLLDAAAMGVNIVEREGVSVRHPARFILVGTMNPEEGELRPQLLDRFGLTVEITGPADKQERVAIVRRRLAYEANALDFALDYQASENALRLTIATARALLPQVTVSDEMVELIAEICMAYQVDGMRADLVIYKTARTLAAWEGTDEVTATHVQQAAQLALPHRQRRHPLEQSGMEQEPLNQIMESHLQEQRERESDPSTSDAEDE